MGEKVLVVQSAEPEIVIRALNTILQKGFFRESNITAFIRNSVESINCFNNNKAINRAIIHTETHSALRHLWQIRKEKYDTMVLFFTGDPSYWKVKYFAFLCGARNILIFNENLDCFFFTWRAMIGFLRLRLRQQLKATRPAESLLALMLIKLLRVVLFPLRFAYLLVYFAILRIKKRLSV